jgi:hypothetical protein
MRSTDAGRTCVAVQTRQACETALVIGRRWAGLGLCGVSL